MSDKDKPMSAVEAIQRIEDHIRVHRMGEWPHIRIGIALNEAIAALREKAEREADGCPHCAERIGKDLSVKPCGNGNQGLEALVGFNPGMVDPGIVCFCRTEALGYIPINYCPMCGRRLTKDE